MNGELILHGMVLSSMPVGEFDRRVVLLTRERGRISAFAHGARRPRSTLVAATNPFVTGTFTVYEGRDSYSLHQADVDYYFDELTSDLERVWYGYYFLEMADYFALENNDEGERLALLYAALRALMAERLSMELVRLIYECRTLVIGGEYPNVFACTSCGRTEKLEFFSMERRGVVCPACQGKTGGRALSEAALHTLRYIAKTPSSKVFSFVLSEEVFREMESIVHSYFRYYVRHEFKSEEFLEL